MRTAEVRITDVNGAQIFQGYQWDNAEWHVSGTKYSGVLIAFDQASLCQMIAENIIDLRHYAVESHYYTDGTTRPGMAKWICVNPDGLHNGVIDGQYLSSADWMRKLFREHTPTGDKEYVGTDAA